MVDMNSKNLMVKTSLAAVRQANIILLMIDSSEHKLSDQELKLLFYAYEQKKSILLIFNKTDLLEEDQSEALEYSITEYDFVLKKIPILWISCKNKKNIGRIYKETSKLFTRLSQKFDNTELNELIKSQLERKPMYHKRQLLKVARVRHENYTTPTFTLRVKEIRTLK